MAFAWRLIEPMQAGRLKIFFRRPAFYEGLHANICQYFKIARKPCLCFMRPSEGLTFQTAWVLLSKSEFNPIKTCACDGAHSTYVEAFEKYIEMQEEVTLNCILQRRRLG